MSWKSEHDKQHEPHTHIWVKREVNMQGFGKAPLSRDTAGPGQAHPHASALKHPYPVFVPVCRCGETGHYV
jgi:hypothetical protein